MDNEIFVYIPFAPNNYDYLYTSENDIFSCKQLVDGVQEFILYQNKGELSRVDKTNYLTNKGSIYGIFRDTVSITNLTVVIEYDKFIDFNYVYIPNFNRYYFVTDIKIINNKLYELDLTVDVLMSYKYGISWTYAFIDRNEYIYNPMIEDKKRIIEAGYDIDTKKVSNRFFFDASLDYPTISSVMYVINGYKIDSVDT